MTTLAVLLQAERMIRDQDLAGWTSAHDDAVLDAIAGAVAAFEPIETVAPTRTHPEPFMSFSWGRTP
jgi:hypothetical protein